MIKRIQFALTDESLIVIESTLKDANVNNKLGHITISDVINEMILNAKVDLRLLQLKHADLRKTLRSYAADDDLDLKSVIKSLTELQAKMSKPQAKHVGAPEESTV